MYGMRWADLILDYLRVLIWPGIVGFVLLRYREQVESFLALLAARMTHLSKIRMPGGIEASFEVETIKAREEAASLSANNEAISQESDPKPVADGHGSVSRTEQWEELFRHMYEHYESLPAPPGADFVFIPGEGAAIIGQLKNQSSDSSEILAQLMPESTVIGAWHMVKDQVNLVADALEVDRHWVVTRMLPQLLTRLEQRNLVTNPAELISLIVRLNRMRDSVIIHSERITKLEAYDYASSAFAVVTLLKGALNKINSEDGTESQN